MPKNPTKKPKVLKRKNIKRRTGAKSQAKQISALSTQVAKITKQQFESVMLGWIRPKSTIDTTVGGIGAYICPIPITPQNPYVQDTVTEGGQIKWSDNRGMSASNYFTKSPCFGSSEAARNSSEWIHTGSTLKWRLETTEPTFSTYSMFLIQAKSRQADQLISDRGLKNSTGGGFPGSASQLREGVDYLTHPQLFGTMLNKKYWKVLHTRQINFSVPGVTDFKNANVDLQGGANTRNNTVIKEGTFKIPAGGSIKCFNVMPYKDLSSPALGRKPANASQLGYLDGDNSKTCYLVIVNNGVAVDGEFASLSLMALDNYKAVV